MCPVSPCAPTYRGQLKLVLSPSRARQPSSNSFEGHVGIHLPGTGVSIVKGELTPDVSWVGESEAEVYKVGVCTMPRELLA